MKRRWTALLCALLLALAAPAARGEDLLAGVQGLWVDVNSDCTLEISGDRMVITEGGWSDTYTIRAEMQGSTLYIRPAEEGVAFGVMSDISMWSDGALGAYEEILDAEGHIYRFVREDALEAERAIRDLSREMPREISSEVLREFSLTFRNSGLSYDLDERWPAGQYSWTIEKRLGLYRMQFTISGDSYIIMSFSRRVSAEYVAGLARLLKEQGIIALNGYYFANNVARPGYYLNAEVATGEELFVCAEGSAAETCAFDLAPLLEYAAQQPLPPW